MNRLTIVYWAILNAIFYCEILFYFMVKSQKNEKPKHREDFFLLKNIAILIGFGGTAIKGLIFTMINCPGTETLENTPLLNLFIFEGIFQGVTLLIPLFYWLNYLFYKKLLGDK